MAASEGLRARFYYLMGTAQDKDKQRVTQHVLSLEDNIVKVEQWHFITQREVKVGQMFYSMDYKWKEGHRTGQNQTGDFRKNN